MGYRLFDCAPVYFNEMEIGNAFHETTSGVPRSDVFVTSKLAGPFHRPDKVEVRREGVIQYLLYSPLSEVTVLMICVYYHVDQMPFAMLPLAACIEKDPPRFTTWLS